MQFNASQFMNWIYFLTFKTTVQNVDLKNKHWNIYSILSHEGHQWTCMCKEGRRTHQLLQTSPLNSCIHLHQMFSKRKKASEEQWTIVDNINPFLVNRWKITLSTTHGVLTGSHLTHPFPFLPLGWIQYIHIMCSFVECRGAVNWCVPSGRHGAAPSPGCQEYDLCSPCCVAVCSHHCKKLCYTCSVLYINM